MAYGKIDFTTWTKAAMIRTIEQLYERQTSLLNRIAELEAHQTVSERYAWSEPRDCHGAVTDRTSFQSQFRGDREPASTAVIMDYGNVLQIDWGKADGK